MKLRVQCFAPLSDLFSSNHKGEMWTTSLGTPGETKPVLDGRATVKGCTFGLMERTELIGRKLQVTSNGKEEKTWYE